MLDAEGKPYGGGQAGRSAVNTAEFTNSVQRWAVESTRLGIPMFMHEEALHGYAAKGATSFPQAIALAGTFNPDLVERVFSVAGAEMRARGALTHITSASIRVLTKRPSGLVSDHADKEPTDRSKNDLYRAGASPADH